MSRHLTLLLTFVAAAGAAGAPRPKDPDATYYPSTTGARWVYDESGRERAYEVTKVEAKGAETVVTVEDTTNGIPFEKVSVSPKGVYRVGFSTYTIEPACVLRFPLKEGDTWEHENTPQPGLSVQAYTAAVGKAEEVEVPAGKFKAVRVDIVMTSRNGQPLDPPERYTTWHAPEVGLVKTTRNGKPVRVLKAFTAGKR